MHQEREKLFVVTKNRQIDNADKTLRSAIIKRSQLKNKAMKAKSKNNVIEYKKQGSMKLLN